MADRTYTEELEYCLQMTREVLETRGITLTAMHIDELRASFSEREVKRHLARHPDTPPADEADVMVQARALMTQLYLRRLDRR